MPQIIKGVRSILSIPAVYSLFGVLVGGASYRQVLVRNYIRPQSGDRVLDIGCGPGDMFTYLSDVEYLGFDLSQKYIQSAQKRFGDRATFICESVTAKNLKQPCSFDIVLAMGILHHLDDAEAVQLFQLAKTALKPGGRLITFDGVFTDSQSPCARYIISKDRGQNVRTKDGYYQLAAQVFPQIAVNIRHDLLRIPYTHIILECTLLKDS